VCQHVDLGVTAAVASGGAGVEAEGGVSRRGRVAGSRCVGVRVVWGHRATPGPLVDERAQDRAQHQTARVADHAWNARGGKWVTSIKALYLKSKQFLLCLCPHWFSPSRRCYYKLHL